MSIQYGGDHPGDALLVVQHLAGGVCLGAVLSRLLHCLQPLQLLVYALLPTHILLDLGNSVQGERGVKGRGTRG